MLSRGFRKRCFCILLDAHLQAIKTHLSAAPTSVFPVSASECCSIHNILLSSRPAHHQHLSIPNISLSSPVHLSGISGQMRPPE
ncbi:hypothetical protein EDB19DRAFT_467910 [Suillus lakei]|nr:hypothetical protein EDB19DRAFT_467910 [Suillus lakei]